MAASTIDFQYGTTVTPSPINPTATVGGPGSQVSQAGVGNFATPAAPSFDASAAGGADITVGTITVTDLALGAAYTDTYGPTTITVNLKIKDVPSNATGTFKFTGSLAGTVTSNGIVAASDFSDPFTASSQTETIGSFNYTVSVIPGKAFAAPGSPPAGGSGIPGDYSFNVQAAVAGVPAPASGWAGLALLTGLGAWRLIRKRVTI